MRHIELKRWIRSGTARVSLGYLALTIMIALISQFASSHELIEFRGKQFEVSHSLLWTFLAAATAFSGITTLNALSSLSTIERELSRVSVVSSKDGQDNDQPKWLRPMIGDDDISIGYNRLIATAIGNQTEREARPTSHFDDAAITQARAMRALAANWVITDHQGLIQYGSPQATRLLNLSKEQSLLDALQLDQVSESDSFETDASLIKRFMSQARVVRCDISVVVDGNDLQLNVTRSRLRGRNGDCEGMVWLLEDRTAVQMAVRQRDEFLMTAAHELRTPLTNLRAYAETLRDEDEADAEQQKEFCNIIVSESIRLGRLVDHLLSMGQIEAGSLVIEQRELDLQTILRDVQHQVAGQTQEKDQTFTIDIPDKLSTVTGDRDKLQAALINLVGNAVKYTPIGGQIEVRCRESENLLLIDVIDDGPGIDQQDQEKVFERFYRCQSTESEHLGNGLGLAMAQEVARLHNGDVTLQSQLGEGSTFTMRLPTTGKAYSGITRN